MVHLINIMLNGSYYYNANLKKIVAVFGTLFNNISIAKRVNGKMTGIQRVPISYGPRQKFLTRLASQHSEENGDVAIKLPRMSFEIVSLSYDSTTKLNKLNSSSFPVSESVDTRTRVYGATPYRLGMQLNILARQQDDALQIFEQIIPYFTPEYTVAVKDLEGPGSVTNVPFILTSTSLQDDYEGDFENSRRTIIYSLDFDIKIKFRGIETGPSSIIKTVDVNFFDTIGQTDALAIDRVKVELGDPENDTPENYSVVTTYGFDDEPIL